MKFQVVVSHKHCDTNLFRLEFETTVLNMFGLCGMWKKYNLIMFILVMSACASSTLPMAQQPAKRIYIVKENDNFHSIAFAFEISTEQLKRANPWLSPVNIAPGMRLTIPRSTSTGHIAGNIDFIWPLNHLDVSSEYGYRSGSLHAGIDLRAPRGTAIYASADGRVVFAGRKRGYGLMIVIEHGNGIETVYAHNDRNKAELGQQVRQGEVIASVGRSGNATGYHVHFEFRRLGKAENPLSYVKAGL